MIQVFVVVVVSTATAAAVTSLDPEDFDENLKDFVLERTATDQDVATDLNESGLSGLPLPLIKQILYYSQPSWNRQADLVKSKRGMSLEVIYSCLKKARPFLIFFFLFI